MCNLFMRIITILTIITSQVGAVELGGFLSENLSMKFQDEQEFIKKETWLRLKLRSRMESSGLFTDIDLRYDPLYHSIPELKIREAYADLSLGQFDLRFGRQIVIWGKADEFNPTDFINPEDYREFISLNKTDRKIGLFYPKIDYYFGNYKVEGIFIPFFTPSEIPMDTSHPWIPYQIKDIIADPKIILTEPEEPKHKLKNSEYALKFGTTMEGFDFSFCYFEGFFDLPVMFREAIILLDTIVISPKYKRFRAGGFDFTTILKDLGLRGELAYVDKGYYITTDLLDTDGIVEKANLSFVLVADYKFLEDLYLNFQWIGRYIFDYEDGIDEDELENRFVFSCHKYFFYEELKLGLSGMVYNLRDQDYMLQPYLEYSVTDGVFFETGCYLFGGKEKSMLGQFSKNDCFFLKTSYYF